MTDTIFFQRGLLDWYDEHQRELPWRDERSVYRIWVSEIMLQQTRVETVIPYYQSFLREFPTVESLANAPQDHLLKVWEGLGYYRRALNLQRAAKLVVNNGSTYPNNFEEWLKLPGVGKYTAGAICSIAYNHPVPAIDGNGLRVMTRYFSIEEEIDRPETIAEIRERTLKLIPTEKPGTFNQALMELGALICKPSSPLCSACPVRARCRALELGKQEQLPNRKPKKRIPQKQAVAAWFSITDNLLLHRRSTDGMLAGLWELPVMECNSQNEGIMTLVNELEDKIDRPVQISDCIGSVKHQYSHFKITIFLYLLKSNGRSPDLQPPAAEGEYRWVPIDHIEKYAIHRAHRKLIESVNMT